MRLKPLVLKVRGSNYLTSKMDTPLVQSSHRFAMSVIMVATAHYGPSVPQLIIKRFRSTS